MARLEFTTSVGNSSYEIHDEFVTIGREVGNHLRLNDPAVAPVHLRLVHGPSGYRLEIADAELKVEVNGESCRTRALLPNDRIHIGGTTLTFIDEQATPAPVLPQGSVGEEEVEIQPHSKRVHRSPATTAHPVRHAPPTPTGHHAAAHHPHAHHAHPHHAGAHHPPGHHHGAGPHKHKKPAWLPWAIAALAFVVLLLLFKALDAGSFYREATTPEHHLAEAESQFAEQAFTRALDSCQLADLRGPDPDTRQRIQALRVRIQEQLQRDEHRATIEHAQSALAAMQQFEAKYLAAAPTRPAARELARNAKLWLERYRDVMRRYTDTAPDVPKVQSLFDRFAPLAQLERPDDAADVLFATERLLAPPHPLYRDAMTLVDGWLAAHPNDPAAAEVKQHRDAVVAKARAEFDHHEAEARQHLAARRFLDARKELQAMQDAIADESWGRLAHAVEKAIQRAEK